MNKHIAVSTVSSAQEDALSSPSISTKHFTATVLIIQNKKVLLILHRKLQKWLPPGGHLGENETPPEAAIREAKEETGLDIELIPQENIWFNRSNAKSFERPYHCMLAYVPAYGDQTAHYHMDLLYLARPIGGEEQENIEETNGLRWFTLNDVHQLKAGEDIFIETLQVIEQVLSI